MPDITDAKMYEAFGLDLPQEPAAGVQTQEPADPAPEGTPVTAPEGAQAQEPADPAQESVAQEPSAEPAPMSEQERKENAARRRKQEQQIAIDQAVNAAVKAEQEKSQAALKDLFAKAGLKNTITGKPITNMEEFTAWETEFKNARRSRELQSGKVSEATLNEMIGEHPAVRQAAQLVQESQAAKVKAENEAARVRVDAAVAEISKIDPTVKSMSDILAMQTAPQFYGYIQKGLNVEDAFYLANRQRLDSARVDAARQQAMLGNRGKDHLQALEIPVAAAQCRFRPMS